MADTDLEQHGPAKHPPCSGLRKELKDCIMSSDCVTKGACYYPLVTSTRKELKLQDLRAPRTNEKTNKNIRCGPIDGHTAKDCLKGDSDGVDKSCRLTQYAFFDCKRSLLDFRNRFRGRKGY